MKIIERSLEQESDKYQMANLAKAFPDDNFHSIDLPYRLSSWALDDPENVRLWFTEDSTLIAWAVMQTPFWTIDFSIHPAHEESLLSKILTWADQRALVIKNSPYGHPCWFIPSFADQKNRIDILTTHKFIDQTDVGEDSWSKVLMRRSSPTKIKKYSPPPMFSVRSLKGKEEISDYVTLHQSVFESKNMTKEWRLRTITHLDYHQELDIVVTTPENKLAAFCICWYDENTQTGQVEPLGCAKEFTNRALGRVALSEGLSRLQNLGARNIFVETDNYRNTAYRLYQSFNFEVIKNVSVFRKNY